MSGTTRLLLTVASATLVVGVLASAAPAAEGTFLGAVGCSQTMGAMIGHHQAGHTESWDLVGSGYGGGDIYAWEPSNPEYWDRFEALLARYPGTTDIWWQLCVKNREDPTPTAADYTQVEQVAAELASRVPDVTLWVSPMNDFDGVSCPLAGSAAPAVASVLADHLADGGFASRALDVSPLTPSTVSPDNCHPNDAGQVMWGDELQAYFFEGGSAGGGGGAGDPGGFAGTFSDDDGNTHEAAIEAIAAEGITQGCGGTNYCPTLDVTRGQMASFLARALNLPTTTTDHFDDDNGTTHEPNINAIAHAGITLGCDTTTTNYCPDDNVRRDQMAGFLARALQLDT